jgi:hypothetical protein
MSKTLQIAPNLTTALEYGFLYYHGESCPRCQGTIKNLANQKCRHCCRPAPHPYYGRHK